MNLDPKALDLIAWQVSAALGGVGVTQDAAKAIAEYVLANYAPAPVVTDEMVDRVLDIWLGDGGRWRKAFHADDWRRDMRAALTAALSAAPVQAEPPTHLMPLPAPPAEEGV